ncbi:hypothetical protein C0991_008117 [Blastosporella zonata]|nr:hypothetical protein C0991_008117 [Blastosporella zonata]
MAEPTKQETEQVFKVLKSQKANKLAQLRNMKIGGNASAIEFFNKHGGSSLLSDSDTKKRYSSRVAELYKQELVKRVKDDATRFPNGIFVEGIESSPSPAANEQAEEDFFDSWSKPSTPKSTSNPGTPRVSTPPIIGRSVSATSGSVPPVVAPRTTTSSAARPARLGSGTSRLNSASSVSSVPSTAPKKSKLGLGVAKPVNFAEAVRKAEEESERIKQLGYDREREEAEEKASKEAEALRKTTEIGFKATARTATMPASSTAPKSAAFPRLGFGAIPGAGAAAAVAAPRTVSPVADNSPTTARDKFGNQKGISSDMYFERNTYDPSVVNEAQQRLQNFRGATAISSNQYFGREEEEDLVGPPIIQDGSSLAQLEIAARDAVTKILANPDVQNVGESIRNGALKLSDYLAQMSER